MPKAPSSLDAVLAWLERTGTKAHRDGMARFAIPSDTAYGVSVANLRKKATELGHDHALAQALWDTGRYEARMLATFVDDPAQVTSAQMERWCKAFDNWAIADTACFALFDRTAHRWAKIEPWSRRKDEFQKRAGFALLWSLTVHDKAAKDEAYIEGLALVEREAHDDRNFVKKAVNMALRAVGKRNRKLNAAAIAVARRLADSPDATRRWVGKDALRELVNYKGRAP